jgi:hypothetical protein
VRVWRGPGIALVAVAVGTGVLATGCSSLRPDGGAAAAVATRFHEDVRRGDGRAACALLVESTAQELEQSGDEPCPRALMAARLPDAEDVRGTDAYGRAARVRMDHDVVFLAVVGNRWQVRAAGCTPDGQAPYQCAVKGG